MTWLVVLDPIDGLIPKTDTSIAIINQARQIGLNVETATIDELFHEQQAAVYATDDKGVKQRRNLSDYELILMRKEPPYNLAFHYATHLLSLSETLVVNSPVALRDFNEKLIVLPFQEHIPPTLVSSDRELIAEFVKKHNHCVIKALDTFQGKSVLQLQADVPETDTTISAFTNKGSQPVMIQKFLDSVYEGDKRVIMLGDKVLGAAMRRPKTGFHANFANSDALQTELTAKEQEAVNHLGPWMVKNGIHFSGLDFIGEHLTEINITCPTGIIQISELDGTDLPSEIVNYFIKLSEQQ